MDQIADVYLGKQTKVFQLPFAADAKSENCFSIMLKVFLGSLVSPIP